MSNEKYVDKNLVKSLLGMFESTSNDDKNLASEIFDNILNDEEDAKNFIESYDETLNDIVESEPIKGKEYKYTFNYIRLCLEHTKWSIENNLNNG